MSAERIVFGVTLGLWPPVPVELRSDFATATPEQKDVKRQAYLIRAMRWSRATGVMLSGVVLFLLWFAGAFAALGLPVGQGVAYAGDMQKLSKSFEEFRIEDMRQDLENRIAQIDGELFQLGMAINQAQRAGREPDVLHQQRIQQLTTQRGNLNDRLRTLNEKHPPPR